MSNQPFVSILINNFNYGEYLQQAIDSALSQTYKAFEVIVVDDGSQDNSREIIENYGDRVIPVLKDNGGQASAFNAGFATSKGTIICFLDADDYFSPEKIQVIVDAFLENPDIGWCFHPVTIVNKDKEELYANQHQDGISKVYDLSTAIKSGKLNRAIPIDRVVTSGMCFSQNCLSKILPMPEEIRITSDDYIKYAAFGLTKGFIQFEELSAQRIHGNNLYTDDPQKRRGGKRQLESAKIAFLTSYWLSENFPDLSAFSNNIFAQALAIHRDITKKDNFVHEKCNEWIDKYFSTLTLDQVIMIRLKAFLHPFFW